MPGDALHCSKWAPVPRLKVVFAAQSLVEDTAPIVHEHLTPVQQIARLTCPSG
jgi:hypothetical protein